MSNANTTPLLRSRLRLGLALALVVIFILPLLPYAWAAVDQVALSNQGSDLWRALRQGAAGVTQAEGSDAGVLINNYGEQWRQARIQWLAPIGAAMLLGVIGAFVLYYLIKGWIRIHGGYSGKVVPRATRWERWVHWSVAVVFLLLCITGLILLYGKWILIPLLGKEGFSLTAGAAKLTHNYLGPLLLVGIPVMFFTFLKDSLFRLRVDFKWFLALGGYLGGPHPSSYKFNAGQKSWFWVAMGMGGLLCLTGLVLDFPNFGQGRLWMQGSHVLHVVAALIVMTFLVVHIYLAYIGMEGSIEGMSRGYVDTNWAAENHDLWYPTVKDQAFDPPAEWLEARRAKADAKKAKKS